MKIDQIEPYAHVIINLYKGVVSVDDGKIWRGLIEHEADIRHYVEQISLQLHVNHNEGYAFLEQADKDEDGLEIKLPRLTRRAKLSFWQTIVLIVLRQKLLDFDSNVQDGDRCIITREEIYEDCIPFLQDSSDEKKTYRLLDNAINRMRDYGFIKRLESRNKNVFIVQAILKSKLNSQRLSELKDKLQAASAQMNENEQS